MPSWTFEAIGTRWQIDIPQEMSQRSALELRTMLDERITAFDQTYSRFREDSWISTIGKKPGTYTLPIDAWPLFTLYESLYRLTHGAMTPLIGRVMVDAGYDAQYSLHAKPLTSPLLWDDALVLHRETITVHQPVMLDVGAAGKGYCIDIIGELLEQNGIFAYSIDAGGDIRCRGERTLRIGLEHPEHHDEVIGVATVRQQSICGSAGNRRAWGDFHHIIHPRSLTSPRHILATWVVADTTMLADALATALWFVPPESLQSTYHFSWAVLDASYSLTASDDFPAEFFENSETMMER